MTSISDMQSFAVNREDALGGGMGNVIELGSIDDLSDDFGVGMLSNTTFGARPASNNQTAVSIPPSSDPITDISISPLEPIDSLSFDLPSSNQVPSIPDVSIHKDSSTSDPFFNDQTATGPSISLAPVNRMNPEEEKKKKTDLINKLNRLETKGYSLTKRFTMDNTLDEIQQEFDRLVDAKNLEASLRFQRQCLMGFVTGAEFMNSKFNPFDWELDGWSESVHENIEDFDEVFEELYDKYKGRGNMPPEAKLLMSLVGSGFMFHMSNSFFRAKASAMTPDTIFRANPELAKQFAAAAAQQAGPGFGNFMGAAMGVPQPPTMGQMPPMNGSSQPFYQAANGMAPPPPMMPQNVASATPAPAGPRREMKGPTGVDDILKTFQEVRAADLDHPTVVPPPLPPTIFAQQPAMQAVSEIASIHSTPMSDMSSATTATATGATGQRRGRRKAVVPTGNMMSLDV